MYKRFQIFIGLNLNNLFETKKKHIPEFTESFQIKTDMSCNFNYNRNELNQFFLLSYKKESFFT